MEPKIKKGLTPLDSLIQKYRARPVKYTADEIIKRRVEFDRAEGSVKLSGSTAAPTDFLKTLKELYVYGQVTKEEYGQICRQIIGGAPAGPKIAAPEH